MPMMPMVKTRRLLLRWKLPAGELNVSDWMFQSRSRFGLVPAKPVKMIDAVPSLAGAPLGLQLLAVDQLSLVPPPSHVLPARQKLVGIDTAMAAATAPATAPAAATR